MKHKAHPTFGCQGQAPDTPERRAAIEAVEAEIAECEARASEESRAKVEKLRGPDWKPWKKV